LKYLIDTNCVIYLAAQTFPALNERVERTDRGEIGLSAITFAELSLGAALGKPPFNPMLDELIRQMPVIPFDEEAARFYGKLPFRRGGFDRLLAGHALALGLTIITRNTRDFADIAGLRIEDWTR
jgi:tRNA(fMet)-specific endonuclease VapC